MQVPIRPPTMTVAEQRSHFPELLSQVDDEFFSTVYAMLATYVRKHNDVVIGYHAGEAIHVSDLNESIARAEEQIDRGEFLTAEELEKETEEWLRNTV